MNNKIEVIGIDHGWSNIKTSSQVFVTGVKEITTEPALYDGVLEYKGRFLAGFGNVLAAILKAIAWLILNALQLVLNVAKVFLLLLGLVGRLFLAFVRAGTP